MSERRAGRNNGIAIGLAIGFIISGLFGWFNSAYMYGTLSSIFEGFGVNPSGHYVFRDLNYAISTYQTIAVAGAIVLLIGVLLEMKPGFSGSSGNRLAGALWGGGGALALLSLQNLFLYMRISEFLYLEFFVAEGSIGVLLLVVGMIAYLRKKPP